MFEQLRQICRTSGVHVSIDTENTRDSFYRASVELVLNVCCRYGVFILKKVTLLHCCSCFYVRDLVLLTCLNLFFHDLDVLVLLYFSLYVKL